MKKASCLSIIIVIICLLVACGGSDATESAQLEAADDAVEEEQKEPEATAVPEPTAEPETEAGQKLITSAEEMAGIWEGTIAGEIGYVMYTPDGRYLVALAQDNLATAPRVSGEYWFEDGQIHLRDLENAGHWAVCDAETVGVYEVLVVDGGKIQFQTVSDGCNEAGFTRNYIFANMTQEWIAEAD